MAQEKIWFVTGASSGLGRLWSEAALERGDKVIATARNPKVLQDMVYKYGDAVLTLPLDVTDRAAVFEAVKKGHDHFGRLDVILSNAGYGYMVEVDHGCGIKTVYAHLRRIKVKVGEVLEHRTVIGTLGSTGRSTGPHVHYEIRVDGAAMDPVGFIEAGRHVHKI